MCRPPLSSDAPKKSMSMLPSTEHLHRHKKGTEQPLLLEEEYHKYDNFDELDMPFMEIFQRIQPCGFVVFTNSDTCVRVCVYWFLLSI